MFAVERIGKVALIRLVNPPVNSVKFDQWRALPGIIAELEKEDIATVVFTGLPQRHFCAGNDFKEFSSLTPDQTLSGTAAVRDGLRAVRESKLIAVAALHGAVMGSGFMLACACDIRISTPDARLGLPEVKVGAIGGYRIAREVLGQAEARAMVLTGDPISGDRAHQLGLVYKIGSDPDDVLRQSMEMATSISDLMTGRLGTEIKACFNAQDLAPLWPAYDLERQLAARIMGQAAG